MDQKTDIPERRSKAVATEASKSEKPSQDETEHDHTTEPDRDEDSDELAQSDEFAQEMKALEEAGEDTEELRRQYLLTRFWQAARGFWGRRGRRIAWILSAALLAIVLLNITASYAMNRWNRAIFDALEKKD